MNILARELEDKEVEQLYEDAAQFPLLSVEQEYEIDQRKWNAVLGVQTALVRDADTLAFLEHWAHSALQAPPAIGSSLSREQFFLLRREMSEYFPDGSKAEEIVLLHELLHTGHTTHALQLAITRLALPVGLQVGMGELILAGNADGSLPGVAGALRSWLYPRSSSLSKPIVPAPGTALASELQAQLADYRRARDELILHNLRLVYSIAGRYTGKGVSYIDLVQEGTLGLLRAAEKFDYRKGFRFSTYCFNWISQATRRAVSDTGPLIRYPGHVQEQLSKLYRARAEHEGKNGTALRDTGLAEQLGITLEKTRWLTQLRNMGISLDKPRIDDDESTAMVDSVPGDFAQTPSAGAETRSLRQSLLAEIKRLDPTEQQVIIRRWGLHRGRPLSRAELADQMAVSREWIRQLERSALGKLSSNPALASAYELYFGRSDH